MTVCNVKKTLLSRDKFITLCGVLVNYGSAISPPLALARVLVLLSFSFIFTSFSFLFFSFLFISFIIHFTLLSLYFTLLPFHFGVVFFFYTALLILFVTIMRYSALRLILSFIIYVISGRLYNSNNAGALPFMYLRLFIIIWSTADTIN